MGGEVKKKEWSVLVYMAANSGDEKLRKAALLNLRQMKSAGSNDDVWVAAQAHLPNELTRRYNFPVVQGVASVQEMNVIEMGESLDSADPKVLDAFLKWGADNFPAEKVLLIFWGHGYGLDDFDPFPIKKPLPAPLPERGPVLMSEGTSGFPNNKIAAQLVDVPSVQTEKETIFGFGGYAPNQSYLQNSQIANVLSDAVTKYFKGPLAILGFDCCEMSLIEVWSEMKAYAGVGLGSQYGVPYAGWPYHLLLKNLLADPKKMAEDVSAMIVDTYIDYWDRRKSKPPVVVTLSSCDLAKTDDVLNAMEPLSIALKARSRNRAGRAKIFNSRNVSPIFDSDGFIDLGAFCRQLQFNFPDSDVSVACDAVCGALNSYVKTSKFAPKNTTKKISLSTGVSVWFPPWIQYPDVTIIEKENSERYLSDGAYSKTEFASVSHWDEFLKAIRHFARNNS